MQREMRTDNEVNIVIAPERVAQEKFPFTFLLQQAMGSVPMKWKGGKPPKNRDATLEDIDFRNGKIRRTGENSLKAVWV